MTTQIDAPAGLPTLTVRREFDAPPSAVYAAHVDPEAFVRWIGPDSMSTTVDRWDARRGGEWAYTMTRPDLTTSFYGSFHDVRAGERIVQTFTWEGAPDEASLETLTFVPLDGGRCLLRAFSVVGSVEVRDAIVASGMESGVVEGYAKLDVLLAALA